MMNLLSSTRRTSFFENVPIGVLVVREHQIAYCNKHAASQFHADRSFLLGLRMEVLISPESIAAGGIPDINCAVMHVREPVMMHRINGGRFQARMRWFPLEAKANRTFLVVVDDCAENQEPLQFADLSTSTTKGFAIVENRHFIFCSSAFAAIAGHSIHTMEGSCTRLIYPSEETYVESGKMFLGSLSKGTTSFYNQLIRRPNGEDILCNFEIEPMNIDDPYSYTLWRVEAFHTLSHRSAPPATKSTHLSCRHIG